MTVGRNSGMEQNMGIMGLAFESQNGLYVARFVDSPMPYSVGNIAAPAEFDNDQARSELAQVVVDSLKPVAPREKSFSSCTDGRLPVGLESGEPVPVREQLVGADIMTGFFMAEALGPRFYANPKASVRQRVAEVAAFLRNASTHDPCGAGDGFVPVSENIGIFAADPTFEDRARYFTGDDFDKEIFDMVIRDTEARLADNLYEGYSGNVAYDAVRNTTGPRGVARLHADDRGVHGHVEEMKVRVRVPNVAIDEAEVFNKTGGREVFGMNDTRLVELAQKFGRGNDRDFRIALIAGEVWSNSGWATLSTDTPTLVIEPR